MVHDTETQTGVFKKRKGSPWHPDNYIVMHGWKIQGDDKCSWTYCKDRYDAQWVDIPEHVTLLVGFNYKFDMLWQWANPALKAFFKRGGRIWDCQYVEYLLHGQDQRFHYCSLTETAPRYGGTEKIDEIKVLWDAGVQTSDINPDLLIDYTVGTLEEGRNGGDIGNTEKIFLGQIKRAKELGMIKAIWSRMDGLCATTEMEYNGLQIDMEEAAAQFRDLSAQRVEASASLEEFVPVLPEELVFNWGSRVHKSCLIFGGVVKYRKQDTYPDPKTGELARSTLQQDHYVLSDGSTIQQDKATQSPSGELVDPESGLSVLYYLSGKKKGEPKTKKVKVPGDYKTKYQDFYYTFPGYTRGYPHWETKSFDGAGNPLYSTSGGTISALKHSGVPFCEVLSRYEDLNKEINTYFLSRGKDGQLTGMLTAVDQRDNRIHHNLNHCATVTSRLSSDNPNLQNVPRADKSNLKRVFTSRFKDGTMVEADYSQLEVVVQGVLTKDYNLLKDLRNKIDFHCKRVAIQPKYGVSYEEVLALVKDEDHPDHALWKKRRTAAKIFSFQRAYGAGAVLIASFTGMEVDEVKELIAADEATYPGIVKFNEEVEERVKKDVTYFFDPTNQGTFRRGFWQAPTGCMYHFRSWPAQDWQRDRGIEESFSPTEMKNYPIQGTGGEIVQGTCGWLWRHFVSNDNYGGRAFLCNTVHDCVWVDSHPDVVDQVCADVKRIMESVDDWFRQFGVEITVPFPVEVEVGPNMLELKHK